MGRERCGRERGPVSRSKPPPVPVDPPRRTGRIRGRNHHQTWHEHASMGSLPRTWTRSHRPSHNPTSQHVRPRPHGPTNRSPGDGQRRAHPQAHRGGGTELNPLRCRRAGGRGALKDRGTILFGDGPRTETKHRDCTVPSGTIDRGPWRKAKASPPPKPLPPSSSVDPIHSRRPPRTRRRNPRRSGSISGIRGPKGHDPRRKEGEPKDVRGGSLGEPRDGTQRKGEIDSPWEGRESLRTDPQRGFVPGRVRV